MPQRPAVLIPWIGMNQIEGIADLSGGGMNPIWLVTLRGATVKLVVKAEMEMNPSEVPFAKANMKAMTEVMTRVSSTAATVRLEPRELEALDHCGVRPMTLKTAITDAKAGKKHLTKMKFDPKFFSSSAHNVEKVGVQAPMTSDERAKAILLFNGLRNNRRAWQTLGQVVIADALIGNGDRISFDGQRVMNYGNLIFSRDEKGNITHALGYDSYDPFAGKAKMMFGTGIDIGADGKKYEMAPYDSWIGGFGQYIRDKGTFPAFARNVIEDINKQRMRPLALADFTDKEATYFAEGMMIGWDKQANAIGVKVRQGIGIPSGLMARAKYLRWVR